MGNNPTENYRKKAVSLCQLNVDLSKYQVHIFLMRCEVTKSDRVIKKIDYLLFRQLFNVFSVTSSFSAACFLLP